MSTAPKRRWFRFSLRTVFVAVTIFCVWLGFQFRIIHQRQSMLRWIRDHRGSTYEMSSGSHWRAELVPSWRQWFGDRPIKFIIFNEEDLPDAGQLERIEQLFPESNINSYAQTTGHNFDRKPND